MNELRRLTLRSPYRQNLLTIFPFFESQKKAGKRFFYYYPQKDPIDIEPLRCPDSVDILRRFGYKVEFVDEEWARKGYHQKYFLVNVENRFDNKI